MTKFSTTRETAEKIFKFLSKNQDFNALYREFGEIKKEEVKKIFEELAERFCAQEEINCFTDGAAQPNPGPAGAGVVIYKNSEKIREISKYLGEKTNNQAEYEALLIALTEVMKIGRKNSRITFFSDSLLLVNQVAGIWRVKESVLLALKERIAQKIKKLRILKNTVFSIKYIERSKNAQADALSSIAIKLKK